MQLIPYRDIILVKKTGGFWNRIVRLFLKGQYSHSEFVIGEWLTFGTDLSRPASIHTYGYNMQEVEIFRLNQELNKAQIQKIKDYLQSVLENKYDIKEAICVGLNLKCRGKSNKYICISIILKAYEEAGVLPKGISDRYKDFNIFSKSPYFTKINQ